MNLRSSSLRSRASSSEKSSKRPLAGNEKKPERASASHKKPRKSAQQPQKSYPDTTGDRLPDYRQLVRISQDSLYQRALLLKQDQKPELQHLDHALSVPFSKSESYPLDAKSRLDKVLRWKLLRGQYRATLPALVAQNSSETVDQVVKAALERLGTCHTVEEALQSGSLETMCELVGIGPATAAAFLSFEAPSLIPVFSDEAASFFEPSLGPIKYTLPFYKKLVRQMQLQAQEISRPDDIWDHNRLEKALWAFKILKKSLTTEDWNQVMEKEECDEQQSKA